LDDFDTVLSVLENPVRRRIIRRLSQESGYPLELAAELGLHQQLITKHLKVMEGAEIVEAKRESSPVGPDRRVFELTRSVSLKIDFSPDLYDARMLSLDEVSAASKDPRAAEFRERLDHISASGKPAGINPYAQLIADIDRRVSELEMEQAVLLHLRARVMRAAKESFFGKEVSLREKMIAYYILNSNVTNPGTIAESLEMRREVITGIVERLREASILR